MNVGILELKNAERTLRVKNIRETKHNVKKTGDRTNQDGVFLSVLLNVTFFIVVLSIIILLLGLVSWQVGASESRFAEYINSGAFVDNATNTDWSERMLKWVGTFMGYALPTMSILSITFVMLSLICTVLYLFKQEYFDQVFLAKRAVRECKGGSHGGTVGADGRGAGLTAAANALKNITSNNAVGQYGFFKCYIMPNVKGIAFAEATDQPMSVADFFKVNFFKIILMFSFCIVISDQTMLNLFLKGAEVGTYAFKMLSEQEYATVIDGFLSSGTDYKPIYDTKTTEGQNKMKVYNAMYRQLKTLMKENAQRTTGFKQSVGQFVTGWIEEQENILWDRKVFSAKCEIYSPQINTVSTDGVLFAPVTRFGFSNNTADELAVYIYNEADTDTTSVTRTTDAAAWVDSTANEVKWDLSIIKTPANNGGGYSLDIYNFGTITVTVKNSEGKPQVVLLNPKNMEAEGVKAEYMMSDNGMTGNNGSASKVGFTIASENPILSVSINGVYYRERDIGTQSTDITSHTTGWNDRSFVVSKYLAPAGTGEGS